MTRTQRLILDVLAHADQPLKGEAVARRCGKNYHGHFREQLAALVRAQPVLVLKLDDGYWLACRAGEVGPEPGQAQADEQDD